MVVHFPFGDTPIFEAIRAYDLCKKVQGIPVRMRLSGMETLYSVSSFVWGNTPTDKDYSSYSKVLDCAVRLDVVSPLERTEKLSSMQETIERGY